PFYYYIRCLLRHTRDLLSFPTRRSSDLPWMVYKHNSLIFDFYIVIALEFVVNAAAIGYLSSLQYRLRSSENSFFRNRNPKVQARSEEHTSELQSRFDLVCRLLLEKKKDD